MQNSKARIASECRGLHGDNTTASCHNTQIIADENSAHPALTNYSILSHFFKTTRSVSLSQSRLWSRKNERIEQELGEKEREYSIY